MADIRPDFAWIRQKPARFLAFGFGSGLAPKAPGTFGTLAALPLAFLLHAVGIDGGLLVLLSAALFFWGIGICGSTEKELGKEDFGGIVWDEITAMLLITAFIPFQWSWWLAAFALFRLLDAAKPMPIKWFDQKFSGGLGIMIDDLIAALITIVLMGALQLAA